MMLDKEIRLTPNGAWINGIKVNSQKYAPHDCKTFIPSRDKDIVRELVLAYQHTAQHYIVGMPYACCVGETLVQQLVSLYGKPHQHTTANLLIDNNYATFIHKTLKIINTRRIILIAHRTANKAIFPNILEHIGIEGDSGVQWREILDRVLESITRHGRDSDILVLSSASYISNLIGYGISLRFPHVSFLDIGTSLHPQMGLGMIRQYLIEYWSDPHSYVGHKCVCTI